jgi:hypothetical protein
MNADCGLGIEIADCRCRLLIVDVIASTGETFLRRLSAPSEFSFVVALCRYFSTNIDTSSSASLANDFALSVGQIELSMSSWSEPRLSSDSSTTTPSLAMSSLRVRARRAVIAVGSSGRVD